MSNNNATSDDVNVTDPVIPQPDEPEENKTSNKTATVIDETREIPVLYETGNPIFMVLVVILTVNLLLLRRRK